MKFRNILCLLPGGLLALTVAGCSYALPVPSPPSQEHVRVIAKMPEQYSLQVNTGTVHDYDVPHDGRIKIAVPAYRRRCQVYLFDLVKVGGYDDPLKSWNLSIKRNGKTARKLSLQAVRKLPTDDGGYRLLKVED